MSDTPRQPIFERRVSIGNVLTVITIIAAAVSTWYALTGQVDLIESALAERSEDILRLERRVADNEKADRQIEGRLIRIETQLERILKAVEGER